MNEAKISINGTELNESQAMATRVAVTSYLMEMSQGGALGDDKTGEAIRTNYRSRLIEIQALLVSHASGEPGP